MENIMAGEETPSTSAPSTPSAAAPASQAAPEVAPKETAAEAPEIVDESADVVSEDVTATGIYEADEDENHRSDSDDDAEEGDEAAPKGEATKEADDKPIDLSELLAPAKGGEKSPELAELEAERQAVLDEFGEDSAAAKAITKAMERLTKIEQAATQQAQIAEARRVVGVLDSAITKHGLTGYGSPTSRTRADWNALEKLRKVAEAVIDANGGKISEDQAIAQADLALKGNKSAVSETHAKHKVLKERSAARTVPSGRSPVTSKKSNPNADLDPNAPDYEARVFARSFR